MDFVFPGTAFGTWVPRTSDAHLAIYTGILVDQLKTGSAVAVCAVLDDDKNNRSDRYESEWNGLLQFSNVMQFDTDYIALSKVGLNQMGYMSLPYESQQPDPSAAAAIDESDTSNAWQAIEELLFDDDAKSFAQAAAEAGIPAPSEDDIGYEVEGADGEVIATVEIAWPDHMLGFLTADQLEDKEMLEQAGWKIVDMLSLSEAAEIFGGEGE